MLTGLVQCARFVKAADTTPRFYPSPQSPTVTSTLNFTMDIRIKNIYRMTLYQVYIDFDPTLLNLTRVTKGTFLSNNSQYATSDYVDINNNSGTLMYSESQNSPGNYTTGVGGNGTLFTITFNVKGTGQCNIHLHDTLVLYVTSNLANVAEDGYFNNQQITYPDGGVNYNITITSNSTAHDLGFNLTTKNLTLNVTGPTGTAGYVNITVPKSLLDVDPAQPPGVWAVILDGVPTTSFIVSANATHTFIYLPYTHSDHKIVVEGNKVIPELPLSPYLLLLLFAAVSMLHMLAKKRKHQLTQTVD